MGKRFINFMWVVMDQRLHAYAAALTYNVMIAFLPLVFLVVSVYGLTEYAVSAGDIIGSLKGIFPPAAVELISDQVTDLTRPERRLQLSIGAGIALVFALWAVSAIFRLSQHALNMIYERTETRSLGSRILFSVFAALIGSVLAAIALTLLAVGPDLVQDFFAYLGAGETLQQVAIVVRALLIILIGLTLLSLIYHYGPCGEKAWHFASRGSIFTLTAWLVFTHGLNWYISQFNAFNEAWGSLATVIVFLFYVNFSMVFMLIGARWDYIHSKKGSRSVDEMREKAGGPAAFFSA